MGVEFSCLGENTEKYKAFSVRIKKKLITIYYKLQFIDNAKFLVSSLSNIADSLTEIIHEIWCKYGQENKSEEYGVKYKDCECYLEYINVKYDLLIYKCSFCNRNYQKKFDEDFKKRFSNT